MVLFVESAYKVQALPDVEEEEDTEAQEALAWILLFVDLVFVALVSKLSQALESCALSVHTFLFIITIFCVLFVTRLTIDDYACRLGNNDLYHRIMYFVYTFANFIMALNINTVRNEQQTDAECQASFYSFGFSLGFIGSRAVIVTLLAVVIYEDQTRAYVLEEHDDKHKRIQGRFKDEQLQRYVTEIVLIKPSWYSSFFGKEEGKDEERVKRDETTGKPIVFDDGTVEKKWSIQNQNKNMWHETFCKEGSELPEGVILNRNATAYRQFIFTIIKLFLSTIIICIMLISENAARHSLFPLAYKVYLYVVAMLVEMGSHIAHYLICDRGKFIHHHTAIKEKYKQQLLEASSRGSYLSDADVHLHFYDGDAPHPHPPAPPSDGDGDGDVELGDYPIIRRSQHKRLSNALIRTSVSGKFNAQGVVVDSKQYVATEYYLPSVNLYQERLGAFVMIMMGEAVIVLLLPYYDNKDYVKAYSYNLISCWLLFLFGIQYYDAQSRKLEEEHAVTHSALSRFLYVWLHLVLALAMFFTSSSVGLMYSIELRNSAQRAEAARRAIEYAAQHQDDEQSPHKWDHKALVTASVVMSSSICCFIVVVTIIRSLHTGLETLVAGKEKEERRLLFIPKRLFNKLSKFAYALIHLTIGFWQLPTPLVNVGMHCILLTLVTSFEFYLRFHDRGHKRKYEDAQKKLIVGTKIRQEHSLDKTRRESARLFNRNPLLRSSLVGSDSSSKARLSISDSSISDQDQERLERLRRMSSVLQVSAPSPNSHGSIRSSQSSSQSSSQAQSQGFDDIYNKRSSTVGGVSPTGSLRAGSEGNIHADRVTSRGTFTSSNAPDGLA